MPHSVRVRTGRQFVIIVIIIRWRRLFFRRAGIHVIGICRVIGQPGHVHTTFFLGGGVQRSDLFIRSCIEAASTPGGRQPGAVLPGMTASGDIVVGKRTVLSYLLSPLLKFRDGAFRDPR